MSRVLVTGASGFLGRAEVAALARDGRKVDDVVLLAGATDGFALLANLRPRLAALIAPSFT